MSAQKLWDRETMDYFEEWAKKLDAAFKEDLEGKK